MKKRNNILLLLAALFFFIVSFSLAHALNETHLDRSKLPLGCVSCHKNHGTSSTVMLERPKNQLCFKCHGNVKTGAPGEASTDIYSVLLKQSNHPIIQTTQYHYRGESLPERSTTTTRHAACFDCHNPHLLTSSNPLNGAKGYSGRGLQINKAQYEYQVCYKCHSDSANLPSSASDIASKFEAGNAAFHPVETVGKNNNVPSLVASLSTVSIITCSDCHNNDDISGAKGPHGSNYDYILSENYTMDTGAESPYAYELCYKCHRRSSLLNDDSFQAHKKHIVYENASCFACHDAHGTLNYANLINFDTTIVTPNSLGELNYLKVVAGKPRCFLTCHISSQTYEHKITGGLYCINSNCPPGW